MGNTEIRNVLPTKRVDHSAAGALEVGKIENGDIPVIVTTAAQFSMLIEHRKIANPICMAFDLSETPFLYSTLQALP